MSRTLAILKSPRNPAMFLSVTLDCFWERGGSGGQWRPSAARPGCRDHGRWEGMWRASKEGPQKEEGGACEVGRCCPVPDRDLFAASSGQEIHLDAWSSRK